MKHLLTAIAAFALSLCASAQDNAKWALVEDVPEGGRTELMSGIRFLLADCMESQFTVVCRDGRMLTGFRSARFAKVDPDGVRPVAGEAGTLTVASGRLTLTGLDSGAEAQVLDTAGRLLRRCKATGGTVEIDLRSCPAGAYLLRAGGQTVKFMKR